MSARLVLLLAAGLGFLAVALGAFGAHGLKARLGSEALSVWKTAVDYHFFHTLALGLTGLWMLRSDPVPGLLGSAAICFALGVLVFSGSLYALSLSGLRGLGAVTPLGGLLFLAGWALLGLAAWRLPSGG
ncbi:MAG TPA: DUF423 domain-containing protein [Nevskiaceae bacterium]|nr:DUF423 domain-containing protein [Nevskiaceae bacterium]